MPLFFTFIITCFSDGKRIRKIVIKGSSAGRPVTCEGYVEMTGYTASLGALF